jgi:hypothetical protein
VDYTYEQPGLVYNNPGVNYDGMLGRVVPLAGSPVAPALTGSVRPAVLQGSALPPVLQGSATGNATLKGS